MKFYNNFLGVVCICLLQVVCASAQQIPEAIAQKMKHAERILNAQNQGKDYWLAVPLNDSKTQVTTALEFYVVSSYNTLVTLEVPGSGFTVSKKIQAHGVAVFSTKDNSSSWDWEVVSSQVADTRGIHIFADKPISVYMLSAKNFSSDGYLGIPTSSLGTDYLHCGYYDFNQERSWRSGFIVIATEDKTTVTINLKGRGKSFAKTQGGAKIGEVLNFSLDKGQVYNVIGDGTTIGTFDLTGSRIHSDKPIGVISYHERTSIPQNANGSDFICEMMPQTATWGKKYVALDFKRQNKGDFYRILARDNNTNWSMKYYDKSTGALLGQRQAKLNAGEYYEDFNEWAGAGSIESFRGVSVWESDKPTLVMQYSYSSSWDKNETKFDPSMVLVTPYEQYIESTVFTTPKLDLLKDNWFNYIIEGDPTDTNSTKLKSLVIDGDSVYKSYPELLKNRIPTTNLYWGYATLSPGIHSVTSASKFSGCINGFGNNSGYSWPVGSAFRITTSLDTLPPLVVHTSIKSNEVECTATELRSFGNPPDTVQIDQGIFDIYLIDSTSTNYALKFTTAPTINPEPKITEFKYKLSVIDTLKNAVAHVVIMDRAGNFTRDTLLYKSTVLSVDNPEYPTNTPDWNITVQNSILTATYTGAEQSRTMEVFDNLGCKIGATSNLSHENQFSITIQHLTTGVYFVRLKIGERYVGKTVLIQK